MRFTSNIILREVLILALTGGLFTAACAPEKPARDESRFTRITEDWSAAPYRAYDFWIGHWEANWRHRPPEQLFHVDQGFPVEHWVYPVLDGKAMMELALGKTVLQAAPRAGSRFTGFSIRYFDEDKQRWVMAQQWPAPGQPMGISDQLQGFERHGRFQLYSTYTPESGEQTTRRYYFSDIMADTFRWNAAFTTDGGQSWKPGLIAEFTRDGELPPWPAAGEPLPNYLDGSLCKGEGFRAFDALAGKWSGVVTLSSESGEQTFPAALTGHLMIDGCAVLSFLEFEKHGAPYTLLEAHSTSQPSGEWWVLQLDSQPGNPHTYQIGDFENEKITFYENPHYVIRAELEDHTIQRIPRDDTASLKKTVWRELGSESLSFEWWERDAPDDEWRKTASFEFMQVR